jgi:hypothetical protein
MALAVAVAADIGELGALAGLDGVAALDRGRVEQQDVVFGAGATAGDDLAKPLDRFGQPLAALVQPVLAWQIREQVPELAAGGTQKPAVGRDPHQHLRHAEGDDLGVAQLPPRIAWPLRQQVVSSAVHTDTEQVEVGVHRGLQVDVAFATPTSTCPSWSLAATNAVASII